MLQAQPCQTCGMCLSSCPTFELTRDPDESPRGRIRLINAVSDHVLSLDDPRFVDHTWSCLLCGACETVCPSAVPYRELAVMVRAQLVDRGLQPERRRSLDRVLRHVFPRLRVLRLIGGVLRALELTGLRSGLARARPLRRLLPNAFEWLDASPRIYSRPASRRLRAEQRSDTPRGPRVAFLEGCVMPVAFGDARRAAIRVLSQLGAEVVIPPGQTCCGALHSHAGQIELGRELARRNIDAIDLDALDMVVTDSAGCGAALREYGSLLADDPSYSERATRLSEVVYDFSEVAASLASDASLKRTRGRITYQDACQLYHVQKTRREPRDLIRLIAGDEFVEAAEHQTCCGSAGTYALTNPSISQALLERKLDVLLATGASTIVSSNPGCLMHLEHGLQERGSKVRIIHLAQLLEEALEFDR